VTNVSRDEFHGSHFPGKASPLRARAAAARIIIATIMMDDFIAPRPRRRRRGGLRDVFLTALACLFGSATCFSTLSILPASLRVLGPASGVSGRDTSSIAGIYGLVKDPKDPHKDSERDPYRVQRVKLDAHVTRMCSAIMENRTAAGTALRNLSSFAVAVELRSHSKDRRTFVLPGNVTVRLREKSYSQSGLGGSLWGSGIGLSILLGRN
jgi:hypothetical protein